LLPNEEETIVKDSTVVIVEKEGQLTYKDVAELFSVVTGVSMENLIFRTCVFGSKDSNVKQEWLHQAKYAGKIFNLFFNLGIEAQIAEDRSPLIHHLFYEKKEESDIKEKQFPKASKELIA
jgi:hypothetical protein